MHHYFSVGYRERLSYGHNIIELMIVMLLLVAIMTFLLPIVEKSRQSAKLVVCTNNLHQLYLGKQALAIDTASVNAYPDYKSWQTQLESVTINTGDMFCPMEDNHRDNFKDDPNFEFLLTPPPDTRPGKLESNSKVFVFRERENYTVPRDVDAITMPGFYGNAKKGGTVPSFDENGVIPAGSTVDVYLFHYDGIGKEYDKNEEGKLTNIRFGAGILGFIASPTGLVNSDDVFGLPDVIYDPSGFRGLEPGTRSTHDAVFLPQNETYIDYHTSATSHSTDGMRVIASVGSGSNYGMNKSVTNSNRDELVFLADSKLPVIDFDGKDGDDNTFDEVISPRHQGKVNVVWKNGSVELMDPENLQMTSFWR